MFHVQFARSVTLDFFKEVSEGTAEGPSKNIKCTVTPQSGVPYSGSHASAPSILKATCGGDDRVQILSLSFSFVGIKDSREVPSEEQRAMFTSSLLL